MVLPFISGTVQRFSYTRWLTSWRTFQSLHGVGSSHWSSVTALTRAPNSSTARRCSSAWSAAMTRSSMVRPRAGRGGVVGRGPVGRRVLLGGHLPAGVDHQPEHVRPGVVADRVELHPGRAGPGRVQLGVEDALLLDQRAGQDLAARADDGGQAAAEPVLLPAVQLVAAGQVGGDVGAAQQR